MFNIGVWNSKSDFATGISSGFPLFDKSMENILVISPFSVFMVASSHLDTSSDQRILNWEYLEKQMRYIVSNTYYNTMHRANFFIFIKYTYFIPIDKVFAE